MIKHDHFLGSVFHPRSESDLVRWTREFREATDDRERSADGYQVRFSALRKRWLPSLRLRIAGFCVCVL